MNPVSPTAQQKMDQVARNVLHRLREASACLVLAESCTAGLIAATLAGIPGASVVLAGSAVVYQLETKSVWLGIDAEVLQRYGVVSREVADQMAVRVLEMTPHATISLSITGHLGPDAPAELDGVAWAAVADREGARVAQKFQLGTAAGWIDNTIQPEHRSQAVVDGVARRHQRQADAVIQALSFLGGQIFARR